ncbi:hypothetical protein NMG60_11033408 [Bertholletia excelsa]
MNPSGGSAARFRFQRTPSSDRFLGVFAASPPEAAVSGEVAVELTEYDIFDSSNSADNSQSSTPPSTGNVTIRRHYPPGRGLGRAENFGILAALPFTESGRLQAYSVFNHKASVPSSSSSSASTSSSSSRFIPAISKKSALLDRPSSVKYNQSAPVTVPMMTEAMMRNRSTRVVDDVGDDDFEDDGVMLPPHEIIASRYSPMLSCSVLEGAGRTLKGRDLRQVRNAVLQKTGFLDS